MKNRNIIYLLVILAVVAFYFLAIRDKEVDTTIVPPVVVSTILNFEDCAQAGFPVMESYPRQCRTDDGRLFAEEIKEVITYTNASADKIVVELPFPGAVTGKEFSVIGQARGMWFFEASFPIDVLDKDGNVLLKTFATAQGEWMTENFVPFKADIKVPDSYIGPATLVLHRDNASGLPEHDASISFPITIEY